MRGSWSPRAHRVCETRSRCIACMCSPKMDGDGFTHPPSAAAAAAAAATSSLSRRRATRCSLTLSRPTQGLCVHTDFFFQTFVFQSNVVDHSHIRTQKPGNSIAGHTCLTATGSPTGLSSATVGVQCAIASEVRLPLPPAPSPQSCLPLRKGAIAPRVKCATHKHRERFHTKRHGKRRGEALRGDHLWQDLPVRARVD